MKGMVTSQRVHRTSELIHSMTNRGGMEGRERGRGGERGRRGEGVKLVAFVYLNLLPSWLKRAFCCPRHKTTLDSYKQQQIHDLLVHRQ